MDSRDTTYGRTPTEAPPVVPESRIDARTPDPATLRSASVSEFEFPETASEEIDHDRRLRHETQLVRARQSLRTLPLVLIGGVLFIATLWSEAPPGNVVLWIVLVFLCTWLRSYVCRHVLARLQESERRQREAVQARRVDRLAELREAHDRELVEQERWLGISSSPAFIAMGSGFWLVAAPGSDVAVIVVTLLCCIYAFGAAVNASLHFSSFAVNTTLNLGQGVFFLLSAGEWLPTVGVSIIGCGILLLYFGRENARAFSESIRIRAENVRLVAQLNREKGLVEDALETAHEANLAKSRFLAAASHDLRQPLHALGLFVGNLALQVRGGEAGQLIARISSTTDVLRDLFDALLDLSRFDAGVVEVDIGEFPLRDLLERVVEGVRDEADEKDLELALDAPEVTVRSDRLLVERVVSNLVNNAVNYTAEGFVRVSAEVDDGSVSVIVRDSGPGIAHEDQERIFDDFEQLNNPARQRHRGTGLGLAIVRRIDARLGLRLSLDSAPGEGTAFRFHLPLADAAGETASAKGPTIVDLGGPRLCVWAIDDDPTVVEALASQLRAWGCDVQSGASRGDIEALFEASGAWPDLVLIDDMLGEGETGLEIAQWLARRMPLDAIVMVTGNVDPRRRGELVRSGFRFLLKPTPPGLLRGLVEAAATRRAAA